MNSKGFTLLEVLVALTILAITLTAVIKTSIQQVENLRYLRDKTLAHWVAMNVLTEIQNTWPALGEQSGKAIMADREWSWTMQISKTADNELRRLDVQVRMDATEPIAVLTGFVGAPFQSVLPAN